MSVALGCIELNPPVFLAPMAGITDAPFRALAARFGAGLVVSEMLASQEMVTGRPATLARAAAGAEGMPEAVQLAGREARWMAEAARMAVGQGAKIIDINFGCPAKKVTNGWSGSALMRDPDHALRLVDAVVRAVEVPVTVKMRLGWDEGAMNAPEIAARAEAAGVAMVTVHGRTRCQFYRGRADWAAIAAVAQAVRIPVIANGDILGPEDARTALERSGAAGVMVGRGARGRPWILREIAAALRGEAPPLRPEGQALAEVVLEHYAAMLRFYGRDLGLRVARKHLGWYLDAVAGAGALRARVLVMADPQAVERALTRELPNCGARVETAA